jgi:hypothetical protein
MARKQVCSGCGCRNYGRAWDCVQCGQTTRYAKVRIVSFAIMLAIVGGGYWFIQSTVKAVLPG